MTKRVAVLGAGPSGLAALRAFQSAAKTGAEIPEIVCFEKQSTWGGLWNYSWRTGQDKYGEPLPGSMYRYLWTNGPKEGLEFADYSFEEHFGKQIASYPPRAVMYDYIEGRVLKAGVRPWIRFDSVIRMIEYDQEADDFTITVHDMKKDHVYKERFDNVIVATGHFSTPNAPEFPGFNKYYGRILHAHDFRDAREFAGQDVLVVGSSYSAEDVGSQCWKYGAKSVTSCYRTKPMGFEWPANWEEKPSLVKVEDKTAYFKDGTSKHIDSIILCTGYKHYFPFLPDDLRLTTKNRLAIADLYKGVVFVHNPKMFYIGMQDQWFTFNMFDAQAWYVRDIILGRIAVPTDKQAMMADVAEREAREDAGKDPHDAIVYQGDYIKELIADTDYPSFDVDGACAAFFEWKDHKKTDIMTFRDHSYRSLMTGTMAPKLSTPWKETLDDSMESYLAN